MPNSLAKIVLQNCSYVEQSKNIQMPYQTLERTTTSMSGSVVLQKNTSRPWQRSSRSEMTIVMRSSNRVTW